MFLQSPPVQFQILMLLLFISYNSVHLILEILLMTDSICSKTRYLISGGSKNSTGEIHVWLREAKELRRLKPQGVDSFVKW